MRQDLESITSRSHLLDNLKNRYDSGAGRPLLCQTSDNKTFRAPSLRYEWLGSSGQGGTSFLTANEQVVTAAEELLSIGILAPGLVTAHPETSYRPIKLLEDLKWGLDENNGIVLYELAPTQNLPDRIHPFGKGPVIRADKTYEAALMEIDKRLEYGKAIKDALPIILNGAGNKNIVAYPIMFDRQAIEIRKRQKDFNWQ